MNMREIADRAKKELTTLTGFAAPAVIGITREDKEWVARVEIVEKESIPNGMDVLGEYVLRFTEDGALTEYEREGLRKRTDTVAAGSAGAA